MKILLLTDIPPCDNFTAGLVLSAMVRLVPRDEICIFSVTNPALDMRLGAEFANIPIEMHAKPNENWSWLPRRRSMRAFSAAAAFAGEKFIETAVIPRLIQKAVRFGRDQHVDRVWAVLQGQTTIRMAEAVAQKLGVPLYTHVWDPFSWWAKAHGIDRVHTRRVQAQFDHAIAASRGVATASVPMAELYKRRFGVPAIPVIASHHKSMAQQPAVEASRDRPLVIGMAGQFYAANEWLQLLLALRSAGWQIAGRPVRAVILGPQQPPGTPDPHVSFLGWKSQRDAAFILSQCDVLYCPYPFDPGMKEVSQFSFPSKLVLYLSAGRPIVFHGPDYSSPAEYIRSHHCGLVATTLAASAIYNELERLVSDPENYRKMAANARTAFFEDFTLESMDRAFNTFIGGEILEEGGEARLHDHQRKSEQAVIYHSGLTNKQRRLTLPWLGRQVRGYISTGPRRLLQRCKPVVRRIALTIPRLNSLYREIHGLYAEKAAMLEQIDRLETENGQLKSLLGLTLNDLNDVEKSEIDFPATVALPFNVFPKLVGEMYPAGKTLVLADLSGLQKPLDSDVDGGILNPAGPGLVHYLHLPDEGGSNINWTDEWQHAVEQLPRNCLSEKLHLVMAHGLDRVAVEGSSAFRVAFAIELARLGSCRAIIVSADDCTKCSWLQEHGHLDYITLPVQQD
ncbi:Glycosyltransferase involved in cell wall bisynthesis [Rhizobium sp. RU33A]|uniref:hypothetical protein n=1 Tax=Rhizobium sp. RU33A TaxID=1907413 RepID=UPI0009572AA2|nr:hypothetical protein [Rhizobium sp. RU33A]SIR14612.1 Glycosyltransferase involved in cell wall bisynthesis [Rhizobium sp. RU33A]